MTQGLAVLFEPLLLSVGSADDLTPPSDRRLFESGTCAQLLQNACLFKFLLETLKSLVDGLVFFYVDYDHISVLGLQI